MTYLKHKFDRVFCYFSLNRIALIIFMILNSSGVLSRQIQCAICNGDIKNLQGVYQSKMFHGVVCKDCANMFPPDDIEMMLNLFFLYGGYFGKEGNKPFSIEHLAIILLLHGEKMKEDNKLISFDEMHQKAMHQALIHGISPTEYNNKLKKFLK